MIDAMKAAVRQFEYILECINRDRIPHDGDEFYETLTALRQAIAQAEKQEPVAWVEGLEKPQPRCVTNLKYLSVAEVDAGVQFIPLYAASPSKPWVSLTDEELVDAYGLSKGGDYTRFARAIEAKLKERNT